MVYQELVELLNVMTVAEFIELLNDVDKETRICLLDAIGTFYERKIELQDEVK